MFCVLNGNKKNIVYCLLPTLRPWEYLHLRNSHFHQKLKMNADFIRYRGLIAVAVGAGVMIGAASVFLYQQFFGERRRYYFERELEEIGLSIAEVRKEINALRIEQIRNRNSRRAPSVTTDAETEMYSAGGGDELDDEFYEFSPENNAVLEENKVSSFEEIDGLLEGVSREDKTKAYGLLLELLEKKEDDEEVLWRLSKACHMMSSLYNAEGNNDKKREFLYRGVAYGERALQANHDNWKAHKWFAICIGARGELQSVKDKLRDGHVFKEHVDTAIAMNPNDASLHHLMGRFKYEVATLSWLERKVASTLFGEVPPGTYKEAIESLLETERLNATAWKENRLLLSKCYIGEQNYQQALRWLDCAKEIPALSLEDKLADKEIVTLLKKYNSYRGLDT